MKIAFICQVVDESEPGMASTMTWLRTMANKQEVESIFVIALRTGQFDLPDNVEVHAVEGRSRISRLRSFYARVFQALRCHIECFFVYQSGPYPVLLLPIKLVTGKGIFQWRAHAYVSRLARLNMRFCDNKVFTATAKSTPFDSPKIRVLGHGTDTKLFHNISARKDGQLVTVGRISPVKRLDSMIETVALLNQRNGQTVALDLYGAPPARDQDYLTFLERRVQTLRMGLHVFFRGAVEQVRLPEILNRYILFLNYSDGALDRAVLEAMACGVPVVSTNPCVAEILPADLRRELIVPRDNVQAQAQQIAYILSLQEEDRVSMGQHLRNIVMRDHNIDILVDKMLYEMANDPGPQAAG